MAGFVQIVRRTVYTGVAAVVTVPLGLFAFDKYEDGYWQQKDPWRTKREGTFVPLVSCTPVPQVRCAGH